MHPLKNKALRLSPNAQHALGPENVLPLIDQQIAEPLIDYTANALPSRFHATRGHRLIVLVVGLKGTGGDCPKDIAGMLNRHAEFVRMVLSEKGIGSRLAYIHGEGEGAISLQVQLAGHAVRRKCCA